MSVWQHNVKSDGTHYPFNLKIFQDLPYCVRVNMEWLDSCRLAPYRGTHLKIEPHRERTKRRKMIYLATYHRKNEIPQTYYKSSSLLFIEAEDRLALHKVVALVEKLTEGDFEESSVEIIGQKDWNAAEIKHPRIKFHKVD
jgi:hypothetical protein